MLCQFSVQQERLTWSQCSAALRLGLRVAVWTLALEFAVHHVYASALLNSADAVSALPLWAVAGASYIQGQMFMVKYFVIFGASCALSQFDQLQTPGPPSCISYVYRYSQLWK